MKRTPVSWATKAALRKMLSPCHLQAKRYVAELLEPRRLLTTTINGTTGADTITVEYIFDIINHWHVVINGSGSDQLLNGDLVVNGSGGNDDIEIIRTFDRFCTVTGGGGDDVITVGGGSFDNNFQRSVSVDGGSNNDTLVIFDESNTGNNAGLQPGLGTEFGKMVYPNDTFTNVSCVAEANVENFVLKGDSGPGAFNVHVSSTPVVTSISVQGGGGDDFCQYFPNGAIDTTFDFVGGSGTDHFRYSQVTGLQHFTIDGNSISNSSNGQVLATWSQTQEIDIDRQSTSNDTFNITEVNSGTSMSVNGSSGDDSYTIGANDIVANIRGTLDISESTSSGGGNDSMLFSDGSGTTADEYTLDVQSFTKTGLAAPITFRGIETRTLNANSGDNLITVVPTPGGNVNVSAGTGLATLIYGAGDIRSGATVNLIGITNLILDDSGPNPSGVSDKDYTFDSAGMKYFVNGTLATTFNSQDMDTLTLQAGGYNSTFTVNPVDTNSLTIQAGAGNDDMIVNNFATVGTLEFTGEAGTDSLTLNYSADTNNSYTITASAFDKTGMGNMNWDAESLNLTTGTLANSIAVQSLGSGRSLSISSGLGNDILTIGTGDLDTVLGSITFNGEGGTGDKIILDDDGDTGTDTYTIGNGTFDKTGFGSLAFSGSEVMDVFGNISLNVFSVNPGSSLTSLTVRGGDGDDTFNVTPSATATMAIDGDGATPFVAEALNMVNAAAAGSATLTPAGAGAGTYHFALAQDILYFDIESTPTPPAPPSTPNLINADDTGISNSDNITNRTTPTFSGSGTSGKTAVLLNGTTQMGTATVDGTGLYLVQGTFTDGTYDLTAATREPASGLTGPPSAPLTVTIDTIAPAAPSAAPDLDATSDNGNSSTDNITNDNTPSFSGTVPADLIVQLFNGATPLGIDTTTSTGTYNITSIALADGVRSIVARFEDLAGNLSVSGPGLSVTIDTVAPTPNQTTISFASPQQLSYTFSEALGSSSVTNADLSLQNLTNSTTVPSGSIAASTNVATANFTFPGFASGLLPAGSYRGMLAAGSVQDVAGNGNAASAVNNFIWSDGGLGADVFRVATSADGQTVEVYRNSATPTFTATRSTLNAIGIDSGAGNDTITVDLNNASPIPAGDGLLVNGGLDIDALAVLGTPAAQAATFGASTVVIDSKTINRPNIENLQFDGAGGFDTVNITGGPRVTFTATQHLQSLTLAAGMAASMAAGGNRLLATRGLSLAPGATLDLNDNDLLLDYAGATQLPAVQQLINAARAGGAWTGSGITSTAAGLNPSHNTTLGAMEASEFKTIYGAAATFDGEALDNDAVLVKYTYYGDADFNGKVNFDDYVRTDNGFNNHRSGWTNGDFDGNGTVNFDDYVLIDLAFNTQSGSLRRRA